MKKEIAFLFLYLITHYSGLAQSSLLSLQEITPGQGLPSRTVFSCLMDKNGFMWYGTQGGLVRYDGVEFKSYRPLNFSQSLLDWPVHSKYKDSRGLIWLATGTGNNVGFIQIFDWEYLVLQPQERLISD